MQIKKFFSMQYFVNIPVLIFLNKINNLKIFLYEINHLTSLIIVKILKN